jgi:hypothetical protein
LRYLVQFDDASTCRTLDDVKIIPAKVARMIDTEHRKEFEALAETILHAICENPKRRSRKPGNS